MHADGQRTDKRETDRLIGTGDQRTRGQIMADPLVARVTGQALAAAVPIEINLMMTDGTLFGGTTADADTEGAGHDGSPNEPARLDGPGPIPGPLAREPLHQRAVVRADGTVVTTTPTCHTYASRPRDATGPPRRGSPLEDRLTGLIAAA